MICSASPIHSFCWFVWQRHAGEPVVRYWPAAGVAAGAKGAGSPVLYCCKVNPHRLVLRRCPGCDDRLTCRPCVSGQAGA